MAAAKKPKKRDRPTSEAKLLQAAAAIFSVHGFSAATTRQIAKRAGVNESLIARYFESKQGLLIELLSRFIESARARELPYPPQANLRDELQNYFKHLQKQIREDQCFFRICVSQALVDPNFSQDLQKKIPLDGNPRLKERLQLLKNSAKLPGTLSVEDIRRDVETYLHGHFLFNEVISGMATGKADASLKRFAIIYSQGLAKV